MNVNLGQGIQIETTTGTVTGRVVGAELRDTSRHGNGHAEPYVCVAVADEWRWFPVSEVSP